MRIAMFMPELGPGALGALIYRDLAAAFAALGHSFECLGITTPAGPADSWVRPLPLSPMWERARSARGAAASHPAPPRLRGDARQLASSPCNVHRRAAHRDRLPDRHRGGAGDRVERMEGPVVDLADGRGRARPARGLVRLSPLRRSARPGRLDDATHARDPRDLPPRARARAARMAADPEASDSSERRLARDRLARRAVGDTPRTPPRRP